ncbi:methyltransferase-like protein 27 [Argopecten irradians]|uniref:methyltransferase-like protein 27 n=1 Tax=Argopecten irradians TaxID=31199 RepID=UPI00370FE565
MENIQSFYNDCHVTRSREDMATYYDSWSSKYDEDLCAAGYRGPSIAAEALAELYPDTRDTVYILDVASGTGLVGEQLVKQGFLMIDALDPSQGMLDKAKSKGVYKGMICAYFNEKELDIKAGSYDAITIVGGCNDTHLTCGCLMEAIRLIKPGGFFLMCTRPMLLKKVEDREPFETWMENIEKEGKWKCIRKEIVPRYIDKYDGVIFVYQTI